MYSVHKFTTWQLNTVKADFSLKNYTLVSASELAQQ